MSSPSSSRIVRLAPSLVCLAAVSVAGCASTGGREPVTISSGTERDSVTDQPTPTTPADPTETADGQSLEDLLNSIGNEQSEETQPAYVEGDAVQVGVLLPFSHPSANVRREAEGIYAGIELALFQFGSDNVVLLPADTRGTTSGGEAAMQSVIEQGADLVLGPLFSQNVQTVKPLAQSAQIPVIAFSTDRSVAGAGTYLISTTPEIEVERLVQYAAGRGITTYAFFGPRNDTGRRAEQALRVEAQRVGATVIATEFYDPGNDAPVDEAKALAEILKPEVRQRPDQIAVLIPERGLKLVAVAPLLPYYDVDVRFLTVMGLSAWNDPSIWREATLQGGLFVAPLPEDVEQFETLYSQIYRTSPSSLASIGYDAGAIAMDVTEDGEVTRFEIENRDGFIGVNGLFRMELDGTAERSLTVLRIDNGEADVVSEGLRGFTDRGS